MRRAAPARRSASALALTVAAALVVGTPCGCDAPKPSKKGAGEGTPRVPNVLLISIDSLRADHVGALGYERPTTPVLDALAADGALFTNAISTSSWTLPAHAALLTGLSDSAHGAVTPTRKLADSLDTLPEAFARAGYRTVGFYSGPFLDPSFGFAQGFERYVDCTSYARTAAATPMAKRHTLSHDDRTNPAVLWSVLHELGDAGRNGDKLGGSLPDEPLDGSPPDDPLGRALPHDAAPGGDATRARVPPRDDRPFFFFVHMWDVHYDLIAPREFVDLFGETGAPNPYDGHDYRHDTRFRRGVDPALLRRVVALYDAEIRYTDATIGLMVDALRRSDRLDDTIVIVTADHGDELLDHNGKGHRHTLFQELIRVPLVVRWPGRVATARIEEPVSLVDVAPTVLELAGLPPLVQTSGRSLAACLRDGSEPARAAVMAELWPGRGDRSIAAIVDAADKVIVGDRGRSQLYDLAADARERKPLPAAQSERGRELAARLEQMRARARELGAKLGSGDRAEQDPAMKSRLRSLGYLD